MITTNVAEYMTPDSTMMTIVGHKLKESLPPAVRRCVNQTLNATRTKNYSIRILHGLKPVERTGTGEIGEERQHKEGDSPVVELRDIRL